MRNIKSEGSYTRKGTGEDVSFDYEYPVCESITDIKESEALALINRMLKVDAGNTAREKAKVANGDSTARVMTPEEKEQRKVQRKADSEVLKAIKAKGLSIEDLQDLLK